MEGRFDFRGRDRLAGDIRDADSLRSRMGSFHAVDGDVGLGLAGRGLGGTAEAGILMTGSEYCRRGFAASLLTRKRACSSTSMQRAQKSEKYLSSWFVCFPGWKFWVLE